MKYRLWIAAIASSCAVGGIEVEALQSSPSSKQQQQQSFLNVTELKKKIYSGRVYQHYNFLSEQEVEIVLKEIKKLDLDGKFETKGLSNTVLKNQSFSNKLDRAICPVPWFVKALDGDDHRDIPKRIRNLQQALSEALDRPTMMDNTLAHECYYSKSEVGSRLPRHMDDRHEELKGAKGWMNPSRRSLSWLIYLSDPADWDIEKNGGALRSYPQTSVAESDSTHDGNLQIGWLVPSSPLKDKEKPSRAVYLDSWYPVRGAVAEGTVGEPHCIIYALNENGQLEYLTRPWLTENLQGMPIWEFLLGCARHDSTVTVADKAVLFLNPQFALEFAALEDRAAWDDGKDPRGSESVDIVPQRGSLVVFDSVKLPHQVQLIHSGTRYVQPCDGGWSPPD